MSGDVQAALSLEAFEAAAQLWEFTVTRDGVALDVSGMTAYFNVAKRRGGAAILTSEGVTPTVTISMASGASGKVLVSIASGVTDGLTGDYVYALDIQDNTGNVVTAAYGIYSILRGVR